MLAGALGVLACLAVGTPADADEYAGTVDEIATALRADPVLVHETLGAGDTAGMEKRLADLAEDLPFDVYVALVNTPPEVMGKTDDTSEHLLQVLHNRLDRPGLYVVQTTDGISTLDAWGIDVDGTRLSLTAPYNARLVDSRLEELHSEDSYVVPPVVAAEVALRSADDPPPESGGDSYATMSQDEVDEIAHLPQTYQPRDDVVEDSSSGSGFVWMVASTSGLLVLLAGQQTMRRAWPGWRRRKRIVNGADVPSVDIEAVRALAGQELTLLADELAQAPADVPHAEHAQQAMLASDAAEHALGSDDASDVVGALVLARTGRRDVTRAGTRKRLEPYRCCYFNPLHGQSTSHIGWRFGDATLQIPVCDECEDAHDNGWHPVVLTVPDGRGIRPYYERDDVWSQTGFGSLTDEFGGLVLEALR